jgi:hypothetical protein
LMMGRRKMTKVRRMVAEAITGTIKWMEDNFHDIDMFVVTFMLKDGTSMTIHHTSSYFEALGISAYTTDTLQRLAAEDDFIPSKPSKHRGDSS